MIIKPTKKKIPSSSLKIRPLSTNLIKEICRLAPPIFRISNRKIEYTSIRETGNFRKSRFNFAPPSLIRYWKRSARDGHGRRIDISFSGTTRYSAARFCPLPPPKGRSHFGQLKSNPREIDDRWINEASFLLSCRHCFFFFFPSKDASRRKKLARRRNFSDERSAVHKFSSIAISLSLSLSGRGSRVIVPIKGLSGGAYFSFVYTGVYR